MTVAAAADAVAEGADAVFTLARAGVVSETLTVRVAVTDAGAVLAAAAPGSVTFGAGEAEATLRLGTQDDTDAGERDAVLTLALQPADDAAYAPGEPSEAMVAVQDDDAMPEVSVAAAGSVTEGGALAFPVTLNRPFNAPITVDYTLGGAATAGDDYAGPASGSVTFAAGSRRETISLVTLADMVDEPDETVAATLSPPDPAQAALGASSSAEGVIIDGDLPVVTVAADETAVTEGEEAVFTLTREGVVSDELEVAYAFRIARDGAARSLQDSAFARAADGQNADTVTFEAGQSTVQVRRPTPDDNIDGADRTFVLWLVSGAGDRLGNPSLAMMTVQDDEDAPAVTIAEAPAVTEGGALAFPVRLSHASETQITIAYTLAGTATAGDDYTDGGDGSVTFPAGETERTISLAVVDDGEDELEETVEIALTAPDPSLAVLGMPSRATGRIDDNDGPSVVTVAAEADMVTEGEDAVFTLTRAQGDASRALAVSVQVADADGVLASTAPASVTFGAGDAAATLRLATDDDETDEPGAAVTVALVDGAAYDLGASLEAVVAVQDNDATPTAMLVLTPSSIPEAGGVSVVTARLDRPSSAATVLTISAVSVSAGYTLSANPVLTIPAGETESTGVVTITAVDDDVDAEDKLVRLSAAATNSQGITRPRDVVLTILDDDGSGLSIDDVSMAEGDSGSAAMQFTVTLDQALTDEVTVDWATADGTATAGADYTAGNGSLTFDAGDTGRTVTVQVTGDNVDEPNETFTVALSNAAGAMIAKAAGTGTITDDDDTPAVTLVLTPDAITEAGGVSVVTASLDRPSSEATTVTVSVTPVPPAAAGDYTLDANRVLTVAAGATVSTGAVTITAVDNDVEAPDKTVTVSATATNTQGITAPQDVTLTITDNAAPAGTLTVDDTTPVVGETLTADTSGIADADGLTGATYAYRWVRVAAGGVETEVGTGQSYTVVAADVGAVLKVEVTYTDDGGTEETVESAVTAAAEAPPPMIFDANRNYGVTTPYRQTTAVDLAAYLAAGAAPSAVAFSVDDCGPTSSDFYSSVTLSGSTLSLVSNQLGHTHGDRTETATECAVTAAMGADSETRTFSFRIVPPRALLTVQTPEVSVVGQYDDALEVRVRDPSGLGSSWLQLGWQETGTSAWERRILSGASLGSANPPAIRIEGLDSGTAYTVRAAVLTREAFDHYAQGRSIAERTLTELAPGLDGKWIANLRGSGQSRPGRAEATTTDSVPAFLRASVNGIVLTVTMNQGLDEASVPAASAFTVFDVGGVRGRRLSGVAVSGSEVTLTVTPAVGADETVTVSYAVPGSGPVLQDVDGNAAAAFTDEPVANETPTLTLVLTPASIAENGGVSTVTATLDKPSPQAGTVTLAVTPVSPAAAGDFTLSGSQLTIAANSLTSTGAVTITANDNDVDAPDKTVTVSATLTNTQGVSGPDDTTLTIEDDEATPTVTLVLTPASIGENGGVSTVTATLDHPSSQATVVTVTAAPESPAVAGDFTLSGSRLTIAAGETVSTGTVTIAAVNNPVHEGDKTVTVSAAATNSYGITAPQDVALTIEEDEVLPVVSIDDASVDEGDTGSTTLEFTVRLDRAAREPARVDWATADGTAAAGTDYRAGTGTLMFAGGDSSKTVTVSVLGDEVDERDETFTVTLSNPSSLALGDDTATGTITDDDDPTVTLVLTPASIGENGGVSTVTATLDRASSQATTVTVAATPESPAAAGDFTLSANLELTIAPGETVSTGTVTIAAVDNAVHAADKTVTVSATAVNAQGITAPQDVRLTIADDDNAAPTGAPTIDDTTPVEGQTLTADPSGIGDADGLTGATFTWQWLRVSGGTDTPIAGATAASYTVAAGDVGAVLKVAARFTDDGGTAETVESAETATVEALPKVTVASDGAVTEGSPALFTLTRTGDTAGTLDAAYEVTAAGDFGVTTGAGTTTFLADNATVQVSVPTTGDDTHEADGSVTVTLVADTAADPAYLPGDPAAATAAVRDDDNADPTGAPTIDDTTPVVGETLTADASGIDDADGLTGATFTWRWLQVSGGIETEIGTEATYVVAAADVGATLKVEASFTDDGGTAETLESAVTSAVAAVPALPEVTVASDGAVTEGSAAVFTLTRTGDPAGTLDVAYEVTASGDFGVTTGAGTATFLADNATVQVSVATTGDSTHEAHGSVTLALTADTGTDPAYLLGDPATATAAVEDNDDSPTTGVVTITGTPTEGETLSADTSGLTDADGLDNAAYAYQWVRTPAGGGDTDISGATSETYVPVFADAGATLKVKVRVTDDEGHQATLTSAPTAAIAALPRPEVTVASDGDVTEGSPALFTLTRTGDTAQPLDVDYEVTASGDFGVTAFEATLAFLANNATVQVSVPTTGDSIHEAHGSVTVTLTADTSADPAYLLGDPATATAAVRDDDNADPTGAPVIDDTTPVVGETLTADASGIDDADGLTGATFTWRWLRVASGGTETQIGTRATYVVVAGDVGSTLKVEASFTDDGGTAETLESAATAAVEDNDDSPTTGTVTITGTPTEGETLTADISGLADADGLDNAAYAYRWVRTPAGGDDADISGATSQTYMPVFADTGATLKVRVTVTDDRNFQTTLTSAPTAAVAALPRPSVTVASDGDVTEGSPALFTLTRTGDTAETLDVDYEVTASGDFGVTAFEATLIFLANNATVQVSVPTTGDGIHEAHGSVTLTLVADTAADPAYLPGDPAAATAAVRDDDDSPTTGVVTITGTPTEGETLTADISGLADADGLDNAAYAYQWVRTPAGGDADISGATSQTYVPVFADTGATLKVRVTVTDDEGHQAVLTSAPTAAVAALPRPEVTVASDGDVTEGSPVLFTLTRTGDTAQPLDAAYAVTASGDFGVTTGAGTATFLANNATVQVSVATTGDSTHEAHGSVTLTLTADTAADPAYLPGDPAAATAAVRDDDNADPTGAPTIDDTTPVVGETLTADASGIADADGLTGATFTWRWLRVSGGTETKIGTGATYAVVAADVGATLKVEVSFTDDGGTAETVESAATSVVAAAPRPMVSVEQVASPVEEGEDAQFRVTRTVVTEGALTVRYSVSETGAMVASGEEGAKSVTFGDGDTARTVTVPTEDDTVQEADSVVTVTLTPDAAYDVGTGAAEVTVTDDESPPGLSIGDGSISEGDRGDTNMSFTVTLSPEAAGTVTVDWATADGTATAGADYTAANGTLTFNAGETNKTVSVVVAGDNVDEPNETFTVTLSNASSGAVIGDGAATGTITDDDATPTVTLMLSPGTIDEDGGTSTLTASLDRPSSADTTVDGIGGFNIDAFYTVGPGPNPVLTIPAGETTSTGTVTITAVDNNVDAPDKEATVSATASNSVGVTFPDDVTLTIRDDDDPPTVTLVLTPDTITEAGGESMVTARLDHPSSAETVVTVSAAPVSPAVAGDYTLGAKLELTIAAGETESTDEVTITAVDNEVDAPDKQVRVSGTAVNGQGVTAPQDVTLTIRDDDDPPTVTLHLSPDTISEAGGESMVTARLDRPSSADTVVTVSAAPVSPAVAGDYTLGAKLELTIAAGETESTGEVTITAVDNEVDAPDKRVTVSGTAANSQGVTDPQAETLTIEDDDDAPTVTLVLTPDTITEAGGESMVTARLDRPSNADTVVTVSAAPVSPAVAGDYTLGAKLELTIAAGETASTGEGDDHGRGQRGGRAGQASDGIGHGGEQPGGHGPAGRDAEDRGR